MTKQNLVVLVLNIFLYDILWVTFNLIEIVFLNTDAVNNMIFVMNLRDVMNQLYKSMIILSCLVELCAVSKFN